MKVPSHWRLFDIDDIIILAMLADNPKYLYFISKALNMTRPALSHRLKKMRNNIPDFELIVGVDRQGYIMSDETKLLCENAKKMLHILQGDQ